MKRVVVGVDGSKSARVAVAWASALAAPFEAEVVAVAAAVAPRDDAHELARWCAPAAGAGVALRTLSVTGVPETALLDVAADEDADLLVIGHRAGTRSSIGSVAMHVAHHATRPFAVVPALAAGVAPGRFVVGLDGSDASRVAALWLTPIARTLAAEVVAAYVPWPMPAGFASLAAGPWNEIERRLDDEWAAPLRARLGPIGSTVVEAADPAAGLLTVVDGRRPEAIVIGTRRLGGLRPLRLGGVTMRLLHRTRVPVIVVPGTD